MNAARMTGSPAGPVDPALGMALRPELQPNEQLRWARQPAAGRYARSKSVLVVAMGIFFVVFANFWIGVVQAVGIGFGYGFFWMFGLPFLVIGLCLVFSPVYRYVKARRMIYAVTDQRVLTLSRFPSYRVQSFERGQLGRLDKKVGRGGVGDLIFHSATKEWIDRTETIRHGFYSTPDVAGAEQQIRRIIADER